MRASLPQTHRHTQGFTLIEIIVSLALFTVVVTIAVGALLVLISSNKQLQDEQNTLSNLAFALDSMTREIRTGTDYYCVNSGSATGLFGSGALPTGVGDCTNANSANANFHGIAFTEGGDSISRNSATPSDRIGYYFDTNINQIYRRLSGQEGQPIVSDDIYIADAQFFVTGSSRSDNEQPKITIVIRAYNSEADFLADSTGEQAHIIQSTVTQRALDI